MQRGDGCYRRAYSCGAATVNKGFALLLAIYLDSDDSNQGELWLTISSCCGSIPFTLGLIGRDGGLSTLCHCCGFACQQRVLKTFPGLGYLCSEDGVV